MAPEFVTYDTSFSNTEIALTIARIERATVGINKDLLIATLLVYVLCLSDPRIAEDEARLKHSVGALSRQMGFIIAPSQDPKEWN